MSESPARNHGPREPFHYRHRALFVGMFLLVPVAVILGLLAFVFVESALPGNSIDVFARYQEGQGVKPGASVNFKDVKIGYIRTVSLSDEGDVEVGMRVKTRFADLLRGDSWAKVARKSMVGDPVIELGGGTEEAGPLTDGDTLVPVPLVSLDRNLQELTSRGEQLLAGINEGEGSLGKFVKEDTLAIIVQEIAAELKALILMVQNTVTHVDRMAGEYEMLGRRAGGLIDSVGPILSSANTVMADVGLVAARLDSFMVDARPLPAHIDTVLGQFDQDLREAETLLKGLQEHGLLRRAVKRAKRKEAAQEE